MTCGVYLKYNEVEEIKLKDRVLLVTTRMKIIIFKLADRFQGQ